MHPAPSFFQAFKFWLKLGFISFGGPTGQIAIMHHELVEKRRWISEERFLHALNYCMLLPGPEAQQLATYIGWLLHRRWGGIVAGTLFILPSMILLWVLSVVYVTYGHLAWVGGVLYGLKPAVLAIVAAAALRIGSKALNNGVKWFIAIVALLLLSLFQTPFPLIIAGAAAIGLVGSTRRSKWLLSGRAGAAIDSESPLVPSGSPAGTGTAVTQPLMRTIKIVTSGMLLWWVPILLTGLILGSDHAIFQQGLFFSKAAMVTFGGAYAVLPYVSQQAVAHHHWLTAPQMLDGLGLAETTPGPLIMVLQFVGFLGAWNQPGTLAPLTSATLGAAITTWATFIPCFLWIFIGAPYVEKLRDNKNISAALSAVTAAVVGVILNLALWFGAHVLFPADRGVDLFSLLLASVTFVAITRFRISIIVIILASGMVGFAYKNFA